MTERCLAAVYGVLLRIQDCSPIAEAAGTVYKEVFEPSGRFQNALIRDHARSILELAEYRAVLPEGIPREDFLPPFESEWPLDIPTEQELEQLEQAHEDCPKLYGSCFHDDFFNYTLGRLEHYVDVPSRKDLATWVFKRVLDMGYTAARFRKYDGYMLSKYGGGRGKPIWAERIGKKYQWIALAQLAAKIGDHLEANQDEWDPEPRLTPLTYLRGRDTDPSILLRADSQSKVKPWWCPYAYDFKTTERLPDHEWAEDMGDVPRLEDLLTITDEEGVQWTVLWLYPEWRSRDDDEEDDSRRYRFLWIHLKSYLVPKNKADDVLEWMEGTDWFGQWMPDDESFYDGFLGEYPWATALNTFVYEKETAERPKDKTPCPADLYPAASHYSAEYEYDCFQNGTVSVYIPGREFMGRAELVWDGASGYSDVEGQLTQNDPSCDAEGPSGLLVRSKWLMEFLSRNDLALAFTVLGEKLLIGGKRDKIPYHFSSGHILDGSGLKSTKTVVSDR